MKKIILTIVVLLLILNLTTVGFCDAKNNKTEEEKVYLNHFPILYYEFGQNKYISINDLKKYGFSVEFDEDDKKIDIIKNPYLLINPIDISNYSSQTKIVYNTDIKVNINACIIEANKINNELVINIKDFSNLSNCKYIDVDEKDNCIDIYLGSKSLLTCPDKNKIHINKKGNDLYSDDVKIGYVKDNILYIKTNDHCSSLYRYNLKNKEIKSTNLEESANIIGLDDKYLYMINYKDGETLCQLNLDTDEKIKISNSELMNSFNFYKDKVIYLNEAYENNLIVK